MYRFAIPGLLCTQFSGIQNWFKIPESQSALRPQLCMSKCTNYNSQKTDLKLLRMKQANTLNDHGMHCEWWWRMVKFFLSLWPFWTGQDKRSIYFRKKEETKSESGLFNVVLHIHVSYVILCYVMLCYVLHILYYIISYHIILYHVIL